MIYFASDRDDITKKLAQPFFTEICKGNRARSKAEAKRFSRHQRMQAVAPSPPYSDSGSRAFQASFYDGGSVRRECRRRPCTRTTNYTVHVTIEP